VLIFSGYRSSISLLIEKEFSFSPLNLGQALKLFTILLCLLLLWGSIPIFSQA